MGDETTAGGPPPGWLFDSTTKQTRWWDGTRWTEHVHPADPSPQPAHVGPQFGAAPGRGRQAATTSHGSFAYAAAPLTSKNGPAKASLILILLLVLGVSAIVWLLSGADPATRVAFGVINILMVIAAFILAIIGLVIAVRRPTKKRESIFALVVSSIFLIVLVGVMVVTANQLDVPALEAQIETWALGETGAAVDVTCPQSPPNAAGVSFACRATDTAGASYIVNVTLLEDSMVTWEMLPQ